MNDVNSKGESYLQQLNGCLSQTLLNYITNLAKRAFESAKSYHDATATFSNLNNLQENIDNYQLLMNMF